MTSLERLTKLCNIRATLLKTTQFCGVHCYRDDITVEKICEDGCVVVNKKELQELFGTIRKVEQLLNDEINEAVRDYVAFIGEEV